MTESTLSLTVTDLLGDVAHYLGYGRKTSVADGLTAGQLVEVQGIVNDGLRQFYVPPVLPGQTIAHDWTFLKPTTTIATVADTADYELPDDFGGIEGDLTFGQSEGYTPIPVRGESQIRIQRQYNTGTGRPRLAATRPKESAGTDGQRFELMLWPTPDTEYTLYYRYRVLPDALTSASIAYPYGGSAHAATIRASCLAAAELAQETEGPRLNDFMRKLSASISRDCRMGPQKLGYNADRSDRRGVTREDVRASTDIAVTVGGVEY